MPLLRVLKSALSGHPAIQSSDKLMLWSAFTLAFFGFLRVSEFMAVTSTTFVPETTLTCTDIIDNGCLVVTIKAAKADPYRRGQAIAIAPSGTSVCAVRAFRRYCPHKAALPLCRFTDGTFLTRQVLTRHLRDLLTIAGIDNVHHYATHSFTSGAATSAAKANLPNWLIKVLARWRSDSY